MLVRVCVHCQIIRPSTQDCLYAILVSPSYSPICANTCSSRGDRIERWLCGDAAMEAAFLDYCGQSKRDTGSGSQGSFISGSLSPSRNIVTLVVHPYNTNILHSPAYPVPSIVPFQHRFLTCLFATRSCGWSYRSEEAGHTDSTHATDNGGCSVSCGQWNDRIPSS